MTIPIILRRCAALLCSILSISPSAASALSRTLSPAAGALSPHRRILMDAGWRFHLASQPALKNATPILIWRWQFLAAGNSNANRLAANGVDTSVPPWQDARTGEDVFHGRAGFAIFRTSLPKLSGPGRTIHFDRVDERATVYLNGRKLAVHTDYAAPFDVPLDRAWKPDGPNTLAVLVQNTNGPGGITRPATVGTESQSPTEDPSRPAFNDSTWRVVHLPDDYVIRQTFTHTAVANHASLPTPEAWYRRTFELPASDQGKTLEIYFEGVYRDARVYLNGKELGEHQSGYTSFRYDISKSARCGGQNVLAVHVDPRHFEGWWYEGGGIYRHVWLIVRGALHVAPWGVQVTASLPEPKAGAPVPPATVNIRTTLANAGAGTAVRLVSTVLDDRGKVVARASSPTFVPAGRRITLAQRVIVHHPRLWSLNAPRLYRVQQEFRHGSGILDDTSTVFGIRTIRFDPNKGFFLNGTHIEIQGVANHQDFGGVGNAVPDSLEFWRVKRLKDMGCNAWRTAHNPPSPAVLDACDRLGMLVMDENRHLGNTYETHSPRGTRFSDPSDLASMILRDRNHPSIILWSMCNEEGLQRTAEGARIFREMMAVVHRYDTTRPITCAMNAGWFLPGFRTVEDVMGINYNTAIYDRFHHEYPHMPMFGSETANSKSTRGNYADDRANGWVTGYNLPEAAWSAVASRPFMAGSFVWTGYDYKGEPNPWGWPDINSNTGLMDVCGFPKAKYYYFHAWWGSKPSVHVVPHWNWAGKEGQDIRVLAFSNCDRVELFLNGRSLGAKVMPRFGDLEWQVPYTPGTLMARGYDGGKLAAEDKVETTGPPAGIRLVTDRTSLSADGEDLIRVEVDVVDSHGRIVPTDSSLVNFRVTGAGRVVGVGNGNPGDHTPDGASYRHAFHGRCMVLVGSAERTGPIVLSATAPGLGRAVLHLRAEAPR